MVVFNLTIQHANDSKLIQVPSDIELINFIALSKLELPSLETIKSEIVVSIKNVSLLLNDHNQYRPIEVS